MPILVATDFSTRSDRALRRATLIARQTGARLVLAHAVDDDQPPRIRAAEEREAEALLTELATTVFTVDGVSCTSAILVGDPFVAIGEAAARLQASLVVMGPHRRQTLRDVFVGTTVERTIRNSETPVIMANAVPAGSYDRVLVATDFSDASLQAGRRAASLGLLASASVAFAHVMEEPGPGPILRSASTRADLAAAEAASETAAGERLGEVMTALATGPAVPVLLRPETSVAAAILTAARQHRADLVVAGSRGASGRWSRFMLGSVAGDLLRDADMDVLVVPSG
ncbi:universal stress protein [Phreatobacter sp.]|uniref:universal stress protein n=1 Tax=Phreatobacter sp. TaxID=1966341 RepID=UPI003F6F6FC7